MDVKVSQSEDKAIYFSPPLVSTYLVGIQGHPDVYKETLLRLQESLKQEVCDRWYWQMWHDATATLRDVNPTTRYHP